MTNVMWIFAKNILASWITITTMVSLLCCLVFAIKAKTNSKKVILYFTSAFLLIFASGMVLDSSGAKPLSLMFEYNDLKRISIKSISNKSQFLEDAWVINFQAIDCDVDGFIRSKGVIFQPGRTDAQILLDAGDNRLIMASFKKETDCNASIELVDPQN